MNIFNDLILDTTVVAQAASPVVSEAIGLERIYGFSMQAVYDVNTPAAIDFVDGDVSTANDTITETSHGLTTGLIGQLTTSGTLPTGLATSTDYYVIVEDDDTIKLASSYANALAGTAVDITAAAGGGTHTFTPTAISNAFVKLQATNDNAADSKITPTWIDIDSAETVSADGSKMWNLDALYYRFVRVAAGLDAGRFALTARIHAKGV